jgi:Ca-activated chloride channel family protein
LDNMKNVVRQLRAQSPNDRFALLAFAGHSYILSPLTTDQSALDLQLDNLTPATVGVAGTSLASAIKQATTLLSMRHGDASRAIILMSDGEDFESMAEMTAEAKRAGEAGITLISVGFGTTQGTTIPIQDPKGGITMKKDQTGQTVVTHYSPSFLEQAAQASAHGAFIPAEAPNKAEQIRHIMNGIKTESRGADTGVDLAAQFQWFALMGLLLMLLDTFIVLRPRRRFLTVAAAGLAATGCAEHAPAPKPQGPPPVPYVALYNKGTKLIDKDSLKQPDSLKFAIDPLDSAMNSKDGNVRYRAGFNGGWSYFATGANMMKRLQAAVKSGSPQKIDSALAAVVATDSVWADSVVAPAKDSTASDSAGGDSSAAPAQAQSAKPVTRQGQIQKVRAILAKQMDNAVLRYRTALASNPNDMDAKWNYELALVTSKANGGGGGKNNKNNKANKKKGKSPPKKGKSKGPPKPSKNPPKKGPPQKSPPGKKKGKSSQPPPVEKLKLPEQQAQQLLNASGQNQLKQTKAVPVPVTALPQGKDW